MIDSCAVRRHCTWPAQRQKNCSRVPAGADFPERIGLMQAYLQPCPRSLNSVVIGLHQLRSSTNRCALLALPTPRSACLPTVEVVRVMAHDSCHGCCCAGQCRVCDGLDLLMPSMHDLHVNVRPPGRALSAQLQQVRRFHVNRKECQQWQSYFRVWGAAPSRFIPSAEVTLLPLAVYETSRWLSPLQSALATLQLHSSAS